MRKMKETNPSLFWLGGANISLKFEMVNINGAKTFDIMTLEDIVPPHYT